MKHPQKNNEAMDAQRNTKPPTAIAAIVIVLKGEALLALLEEGELVTRTGEEVLATIRNEVVEEEANTYVKIHPVKTAMK